MHDEQCDEAAPADFEALLNSDRLQYDRALAVQRLQRNPYAIYAELKYHVAWNAVSRKPLFINPAEAAGALNNIFMTCSGLIGGFASLLWLASDHIHLYTKSDGEKSVDSIVRHLKRLSAKALYELAGTANRKVWDNVYFVETLG